MLTAYQLGFGDAQAGVVTGANEDSPVDTANLTVYTFSGAAIGTAAIDRKVVVVVVGGTGTDTTVSTLTVGGVSPANVAVAQVSNESCEIWHVELPTGTTADIVVTWGAGTGLCGVGVYAVYGAQLAVHATATSTGSAPASAALEIPGNGIAIGGVILASATDRTFVWANLTEDYDEVVQTGNATHSGAISTTAGTPTITATSSAAGTRNPVMALASWRPR